VRRERLRPGYDPEKLSEIYAKPHDHRAWTDHLVRVETTKVLATHALGSIHSAADLSCGNGAIVDALGAAEVYHGDYAPGYPITGPIEDTVEQIPYVDAFVCSETIEHLDDPDTVLARIRTKTRALVLSTPVEAWGDHNPEHYWAWDRGSVEEMLAAAGFTPFLYAAVDLRPANAEYCFGIWVCR
jgi:hypothetical protein